MVGCLPWAPSPALSKRKKNQIVGGICAFWSLLYILAWTFVRWYVHCDCFFHLVARPLSCSLCSAEVAPFDKSFPQFWADFVAGVCVWGVHLVCSFECEPPVFPAPCIEDAVLCRMFFSVVSYGRGKQALYIELCPQFWMILLFFSIFLFVSAHLLFLCASQSSVG